MPKKENDAPRRDPFPMPRLGILRGPNSALCPVGVRRELPTKKKQTPHGAEADASTGWLPMRLVKKVKTANVCGARRRRTPRARADPTATLTDHDGIIKGVIIVL